MLSVSAIAHETPIALLEIREQDEGLYYTSWTYSSSVNMQAPTAVYPPQCQRIDEMLDCGTEGLYGELSFERLGVSYSAVVVRLTRLGGALQSYTLTGSQPGMTLTADGRLPMGQVAGAYVPLGIEHILLGVDHLLFVLGLMVLVRGARALIKTITAFTIAHSLTLAAATFGWIGVAETPVNAAIALSIVVLCVEIVLERRGHQTLSGRFPWAVAFGFGLLHGLGFASALTDAGLAAENVPLALLFFNIGVELGQLAFVLLVVLLVASHRQLSAALPQWTSQLATYAVGAVASYWCIERVALMLSPPMVVA